MTPATNIWNGDSYNGRKCRKALSALAASIVIGLSLIIGHAAKAQSDAVKPDTGANVLVQLGKGLSQATEPMLPVNSERTRLALQLEAGLAPEATMSAIGDILLSEQLPKFQEKLKSLPEHQQALASAAFSNAFRAAQSRSQMLARQNAETYYAERLSEDELKTIIVWNDSELTKRMRTDPTSITPDEHQAAGLYIIGHPAVMKLISLVAGYAKTQLAEQPAINAAFQADFHQRLCQNLATTGVRLSTCPIPHPLDLADFTKPGPSTGNVHWVSEPQGPALSQFYPERAQRLNKSGTARAVCTITAEKRLSGCGIIAEAPAGYAFGDALLKLSRFYQAAPEVPTGMRVVIALSFKVAK